MTSRWAENFDFYETTTSNGARAMVLLELGAADHAPLRSHPVRLQFRLKLLQPREDGLRSDEEKDALFALEDRFIDAIVAAHEAIYVGRVTSDGYTEFYFYAPAKHRNAWPTVNSTNERNAPYEFEWFDEDDAEWSTYFELFPNRYALQTMANRSLVRQMVEAEDRLEIPRLVDHMAFFPSREQGEAAARALAAAGFLTDPVEPPGEKEGGWALQFHREDHCEGDRPDEFVFEVLDLIDPHEGQYDGWGSPVQRAPS